MIFGVCLFVHSFVHSSFVCPAVSGTGRAQASKRAHTSPVAMFGEPRQRNREKSTVLLVMALVVMVVVSVTMSHKVAASSRRRQLVASVSAEKKGEVKKGRMNRMRGKSYFG